MKKIILSLLIGSFSILGYSQVNTFNKADMNSFYGLYGSQNLLFDYTYFINEIGLDGTAGNDYLRDINVWFDGDTLKISFSVGKFHSGNQLFKCAKFLNKSTTDSLYTDLIEIVDIPAENYSIGFSYFGGDTILCTQNSSLDTILKLDRNFNRLAPPIFFNETLFGTNVLCVNKIFQDDSGYYYYPVYDRPSALEYNVKILRSLSPNNIGDWRTVDTVEYIDSVRRPEEPFMMRGKNGSIHCGFGSDWGSRAWITTSTDGGLTFGEAHLVGTGRNLPKGIMTQDSVLIYLPSRTIAWFSNRGEPKFVPQNRYVENAFVKDATYYTNILFSYDNGITFYEDAIDAGKVGNLTASVENLSEGADVIEIGKDTIRVYYTQGNLGFNEHSIGSIYYVDIILEKEGHWRVMGGAPLPNVLYRNNHISNKYSITDSAGTGNKLVIKQRNDTTLFIGTPNNKVFINNNVVIGDSLGDAISSLFNFSVVGGGSRHVRYNGNSPSMYFDAAGGTPTNLTDLPILSVGTDLGGFRYRGYKNNDWRFGVIINPNFHRWNGNEPVTSYDIQTNIGTGMSRRINVDTVGTVNIKGIVIIDSSLTVKGVITVTSTTIDVIDGNFTILADCGLNAITINLPAALDNKGRILNIKLINNTNSLTIDGNGSETIDGSTTIVLNSLNEGVTLICDGNNWYIF